MTNTIPTISYASLTDTGKCRLANEDAFNCEDIGGQPSGKSRWTVIPTTLMMFTLLGSGHHIQLPLLGAEEQVGTLTGSPTTAVRPSHNRPGPASMVWIPTGTFTMGSDAPEAAANEGPPHQVRVDGFWIDVTEVTNAEFGRFVSATGHITTAEKTPNIEEIMKQVPPGTPPPPKEVLVPGALVFTSPRHQVELSRYDLWWTWMPGANWRHPEGPGSNINGREEHPVVQISWFDAVAYAKWAHKRLPTEAEWEYAAWDAREGHRHIWGKDLTPENLHMANIWQGEFPHQNLKKDGHAHTAPVKSFPPNLYGLYDMAGNVWEWCSDWYRPDTYRLRQNHKTLINPTGHDRSFNPREPFAPQRVLRGGSFLCHASYCESYRPTARRGNSPDTGMSHLGFRCVMTPKMWKRQQATP